MCLTIRFKSLRQIHTNNFLSFMIIDSAFKQQRLPAWQPILTAGTVLPTFFVIGVAFIPIGIGMMYFSANVSILLILDQLRLKT